MIRVIATIERRDARWADMEARCQRCRENLGAQVRMLGQQPKRSHHVRLAAAHRLGQLEGGLIGLSAQAQ
jgi:hypothetical protein